ncbi:hypothetical protein FSP39_024611 [Pinctada imbricata]|uniref:Uncharacterized protein n=1 Tax=Pinctada imbricata TaxID=66713 RepID=A0AA88Y7X5_PINIB|nr:hypothetical protein FSP39_024611 [Pinctada imbricata]
MGRIFPGHPPIPPSPYMGDIDTSQRRLNLLSKPSITPFHHFDKSETYKHDKPPVKRNDSPTTKPVVTQLKHKEEIINSVPLSITVAVGCSLLFLNVILFTAVYHQRRRIQGLSRRNNRNTEEPNNDSSNNGQSEEEENFDYTEPKQSSLRHTTCADDKDKLNIQHNPLYSVICKSSSADSSHRCSYESVSTDSSSPSRSTSKKILPNNTLPSLTNDKKALSSESCSPKPNRNKLDDVTPNHVIVNQPNSNKDAITVV